MPTLANRVVKIFERVLEKEFHHGMNREMRRDVLRRIDAALQRGILAKVKQPR